MMIDWSVLPNAYHVDETEKKLLQAALDLHMKSVGGIYMPEYCPLCAIIDQAVLAFAKARA